MYTILSIFSDFSLILKLLLLVAIVAFVRQRVTHNTIAIILIVLAATFMIFFYWPIFGTAYLIYILMTIGISAVLVDTFFVTMGRGGKEAMEMRDEVHTGTELQERVEAQHKSHKQHVHMPHPRMMG